MGKRGSWRTVLLSISLAVLGAICVRGASAATGSVDVEVLDRQGIPVADAVVELFHDDSDRVVDGLTDLRGHRLFEGVPTGRWFVKVQCGRCWGFAGQYIVVESDRVTQIAISVSLKDPIPGPTNLVPCATITASPGYWIEVKRRVLKNLNILESGSIKPQKQLAGRMVVLPDGWPEWAVSVYLDDRDQASVVAVRAEENILYANIAHQTTDGYTELVATSEPVYQPVEEYEIDLDRSIAEKIQALFLMATKRLVPEDARVVLHGTEYEFVTWEAGAGRHCGLVQSPEAGSKTRLLVRVGESLRNYAASEPESRAATEEQLRDVLDWVGGLWAGDFGMEKVQDEAGVVSASSPDEELDNLMDLMDAGRRKLEEGDVAGALVAFEAADEISLFEIPNYQATIWIAEALCRLGDTEGGVSVLADFECMLDANSGNLPCFVGRETRNAPGQPNSQLTPRCFRKMCGEIYLSYYSHPSEGTLAFVEEQRIRATDVREVCAGSASSE